MTSKGAAIVTGAAQGIGRAIALRLASDGFDVAINDLPRSQEALDALSREIVDKHGRKVCCVPGDVSEESVVEAMVTRVVGDLGRLDVSVLDTTVEEWDRLFAINVRSVFLCYKYAGRQMLSQGGGGRIIGASSVVGKRGQLNASAYSASKFAIRGLTQATSQEFGPYGITVNAYAPGTIDTPLLKNLGVDNMDELYEKEKKLTDVGYIGLPEDIASVVSYLASKEAHFITGQSVSVNGGRFYD